jgi:HlyD family secretion protein
MSAIGFDMAGSLAEMPARAGDEVRAGQVLARLEGERQELLVAAAQDGVDVAEATLALKRQLAERARGMEARGTGSRAGTMDADGEVVVARALARKAHTALKLEQERLERHTLRAPYDGVVISVLQAKGAALQSGAPLLTVAERASYRIVAYVDEARAGMVQPGQAATVVLRSRQGMPIQGKVDRIAPQSDKIAEERQISIAIDASLPALYLAEQADVDVEVGRIERGLLVPESTIRDRRANDGRIWGVSRGRLVDLPVKLGRRLGDGRIEVTSPLPADTQVVATRLLDARAGDTVSVVSGAAP